MMLNFMEIRSNNPRMIQNQICNQLGTSDSTIKRYRDDIQMDSPQNRKKYRKKNKKSKSTVTQTQYHITNETPKNKKNTKNKKKNDLKGGSVLENNREDNTKFITIARKMLDHI